MYIGSMLGQMGISRGKYVGPAWQLVASPHGPHHWQPMWGPWECHSLAIHGANTILLSGAPCGTNMDISRGQNVGPTQQLTASPHGTQQWELMCGPWEWRHWPFMGPMGFCYLGNLSKRWQSLWYEFESGRLFVPLIRTAFNVCKNFSNDHGNGIHTKHQHFTIM